MMNLLLWTKVEISNRMHGIYNNQDKTVIHQYIVGNMLVAMKGYALGLWERRFSTNKYSVALGGESEGSINTLSKMVVDTFGNKKSNQQFIEGSISFFFYRTKNKRRYDKSWLFRKSIL